MKLVCPKCKSTDCKFDHYLCGDFPIYSCNNCHHLWNHIDYEIEDQDIPEAMKKGKEEPMDKFLAREIVRYLKAYPIKKAVDKVFEDHKIEECDCDIKITIKEGEPSVKVIIDTNATFRNIMEEK